MRRSIQILLWILVGAIASGVGIGYFFHRANTDRRSLMTQMEEIKQQLAQTKTSNEKLAQQANEKLTNASNEITQAQQMLKDYQEEQRLLAQAIPLPKPAAWTLKSWTTDLSLPLGLSLQIPPGSMVTATGTIFTLARRDGTAWLMISGYHQEGEQFLEQALTDTSTVVFLVNGRLLLGVRGDYPDRPGTYYVLRTQQAASSTHLIWGRTINGVDEYTFLNTIATLNFRP